ncbi:hypothetical protein [Aquamicrobium sp.]|uniref:hypothetical protein n=1 Tax=Aquamicrobium sp. TaxID=1872579 RepID=UPI0025910722|nr:hypothetical protein [Aquamicrobium sp.]MCK9550547.1 hypothetical protein [Aquamicrobium sp.]
MTRYTEKNERKRHDNAISVWDNEGGASGDEQYGRRIEADRSWTVHNVFTGMPASREGQEMIGLSRSVATDGMLSLNRRNDARRKEHADALLRAPLLFVTAGADQR